MRILSCYLIKIALLDNQNNTKNTFIKSADYKSVSAKNDGK